MPTWRADAYELAGPVRLGERTPELYLSTLGRFRSTGRFVYQQVSPHHALHVVHAGRGEMVVGGRPYEVGAGDVFTFFPGSHYDYHDTPLTPWRYTWLALEGSSVDAALAQAGITRDMPLLHGDIAPMLERLFDEICQVYQRPTIAPTYAVAAAWRIVDALAEANPARLEPRGVAEAARFLLDRQAMGVMGVEDLAKHLGVDRATLFRRFRGTYGISPKQYLDDARLARAEHLLRQSPNPLKQIATACGYASSQYFIRAFRRRHGISPGKWREVQGSKPA